MNKHVEKAMELRESGADNCAQAIMKTYAEEIGLTEDIASCISCNFGGGMKSGSTCGAVTSALMVLGAKGIEDPAKIREFKKTIMNNHEGTIICSELLKANAEKGGKKKEHCDSMIREAIELIDEYTAK
ncbi:C_GCAxxG_C_C family probable redox protein [Clostridium sp. DSM 8431]|uniref:C-GCAxxG-C-C family protein n=1 Tax=Clostridium sp. DSM 8431 TaxID=1761781 RepID=UPI0008E251D3|nr:C-GCAxxG-C-C family protein [Clostridium sp. DSM 8431]SFU35690.1 C_GCAxxG_C_C family probable redox protein [Clostridium sp. DSM 8431]